ncbi:MAG TPA: hypothetical protein VGR78_00480 [Verrucomicrobiae bacterium]|jgi:hypothetical protein|nr:hypothetical protein [Verrucomicrobiae bacterium]
MTHKLDADDFFIHRIQQHCAESELNFFLVEPLWVQRFYEYYARNEVWSRVLLNMHSEHHLPDDIYHRLVLLAHHKNTRVIDPPDVAQAAFDKARMHERLLAAGFNVPFTIAVAESAVSTVQLTAEQREQIGSPFVIKPSHGYGRRGVVLDARSEADLTRSVSAWPNPSYLLQRRIIPKNVGDAPAYWRVFYVFGEIWICWWNCYTDRYRPTTVEEREKLQLSALTDLARRIAELTRMNFFSSEVAQVESGEFVLIDYVNDQCHMLSQSADPKMGVPDAVVAGIARRLVGAAVEMVGKAPRVAEQQTLLSA